MPPTPADDPPVHPADNAPLPRGPQRWIRALLVILAAIALWVAGCGDDDEADVGADSNSGTENSSSSDSAAPDTDSTSSSTTSTTTAAPSDDATNESAISAVDDGLIVFPRRAQSFTTAEQTVDAYLLEAFGVQDAPFEVGEPDGRVLVVGVPAVGEGGAPLDAEALRITLVETDGSWDIVDVTSASVQIDTAVVDDDVTTITVTGEGTGFEGNGQVSVTSRCDPDTSVDDQVQLGAGADAAEFEVSVPAPECDTAIVTVTTTDPIDGAIPYVASVALRLDGA